MADMKKDRGAVYVLLSAVCFATGGVLIKMNTWSGISISGIRCIFTFLVMAGYLKYHHRPVIVNKGTMICALANFAMGMTFVSANKLTSAANAIVLQFTMPIFIIIFMWVFFHKKPDRLSLVCCALSFVGMLFFFFDSLTPSGLLGIILAILSGALYGVVFISKKIKGCDFESAILISCIFSLIFALPMICRESAFSMVNLASCVALGAVQLGVAYILLSKGLETVNPVGAALLSMIEPVLNPIMVAVIFGEFIGKNALVGAVIVLGSSLFYNLIGARQEG